MRNAPTPISPNHLRALDTAARAAQALAALGITGARLLCEDRGIPLIQIDAPPAEAELIRTSYYGYETPGHVYVTCMSSYAGAVLVWVEERAKPRRRLH